MAQDTTIANRTPAFWTLGEWPQDTEGPGVESGSRSSRLGTAVASLCRYYKIPYDDDSPIASSLSPLAWPRVFAGDTVNPLRMKLSFERLAAGNGLVYRELIVLEPREAGDSLVNALLAGTPVLLNAPDWPIIYGYDRRETDPWWWVQRGTLTEIFFESERRESYMYWTDSPLSNLSWAILGRDSAFTGVEQDREAAAFTWLETVSKSVNGDPAAGVEPYPLSIRAFRDRLAESESVPDLAEPVNDADPLGIRRVRQARLFAIELLEWLSLMSVDTTQTSSLRLSLYYYHNSLQEIDRVDSLLYAGVSGAVPPTVYRDVWEREAQRARAVKALNQMLEWEKQAAEQIALVIAQRAAPKKR